MRTREMRLVLIIKRCNLIDMAGIYEEIRDIRVEEGKIVEIAKDIDPERYKDAKIIDANNNLVTPGIVEPHSEMGVREQIYRHEGNDSNEVTRESGVTTVVACPGDSNLIGGTFAAFKTYGSTIDQMVIEDEIAFKVSLGNTPKKAYGNRDMMPKTRMASAAMIREAFIKAKEYHRRYHSDNPPKFDMKMHSLMRIYDGMLVKFTAHQAYDIVTAIRLGEEFNLNYTVDKCSEAYLIADELKEFNPKLVIGPAYGGKREHEIRNRDTIIGSVMEKSGLDFCISTGHPTVDISMTMVQTIMMHKKGLSRKIALEAMTINAANMVGLGDRIGSIEVGKDADIVIWDGEPLDYYTSPKMVIIDGNIM